MIPLNLDLRYGTISSLIDPNSVQTAWKNNDGLGRVTQETIVAYNNGNYLAASQDGGATLAGFVGGALGGAEFAFFFWPCGFFDLACWRNDRCGIRGLRWPQRWWLHLQCGI